MESLVEVEGSPISMIDNNARPKRARAGSGLKKLTALERTNHIAFYFPLGCNVRAAWTKARGKEGNLGKKDWYYGYIKGYNKDGTYFIHYEDDDEADFVPECDIELKEPPSNYKRGDVIPLSCISVDVELRQLSDDLDEALQIQDQDKCEAKENAAGEMMTVGDMTVDQLLQREDGMYFHIDDYDVEHKTSTRFPSIEMPRKDGFNSFRYDSLLKFMKKIEMEVFARGQCHSLACQYGSGDFEKNGHNKIKKLIQESLKSFGNLREAFTLLEGEENLLLKRIEEYSQILDAEASVPSSAWGSTPTFNIGLANALKRDIVMFQKITGVSPERCTIEVCRHPIKRNVRGAIVSVQTIICEENDIWKFVRKNSVFLKYNGHDHYIAIIPETKRVTSVAVVTPYKNISNKRKADMISKPRQREERENSAGVYSIFNFASKKSKVDEAVNPNIMRENIEAGNAVEAVIVSSESQSNEDEAIEAATKTASKCSKSLPLSQIASKLTELKVPAKIDSNSTPVFDKSSVPLGELVDIVSRVVEVHIENDAEVPSDKRVDKSSTQHYFERDPMLRPLFSSYSNVSGEVYDAAIKYHVEVGPYRHHYKEYPCRTYKEGQECFLTFVLILCCSKRFLGQNIHNAVWKMVLLRMVSGAFLAGCLKEHARICQAFKSLNLFTLILSRGIIISGI